MVPGCFGVPSFRAAAAQGGCCDPRTTSVYLSGDTFSAPNARRWEEDSDEEHDVGESEPCAAGLPLLRVGLDGPVAAGRFVKNQRTGTPGAGVRAGLAEEAALSSRPSPWEAPAAATDPPISVAPPPRSDYQEDCTPQPQFGGAEALSPAELISRYSVGSAKHQSGKCRICQFYLKNTCRNGQDCAYCHAPHSKDSRPDKKTRERAKVKEARAKLQEHEGRLAKTIAAPFDLGEVRRKLAAEHGPESLLDATAQRKTTSSTDDVEGPDGKKMETTSSLLPDGLDRAELARWIQAETLLRHELDKRQAIFSAHKASIRANRRAQAAMERAQAALEEPSGAEKGMANLDFADRRLGPNHQNEPEAQQQCSSTASNQSDSLSAGSWELPPALGGVASDAVAARVVVCENPAAPLRGNAVLPAAAVR